MVFIDYIGNMIWVLKDILKQALVNKEFSKLYVHLIHQNKKPNTKVKSMWDRFYDKGRYVPGYCLMPLPIFLLTNVVTWQM